MKFLQKILYVWRLIAKVIAYASFGICSTIFTLTFPFIFIVSGLSKKRSRLLARAANFRSFQLFVLEMKLLGILTVHVEHKERFQNFRPCVIVANHPSFLDVVILFSIIPNANCIVKGSLAKTPFVNTVVSALFIPNTLPFEEQLERARIGMNEGESLIIFPEGTRTKSGEPLHFKKGAARFAIHSGRCALPIYIGGNEKIGIRKNDAFFRFHPSERYHYNLDLLLPIFPGKFEEHSKPAAVELLTKEMQNVLELCRNRDPEKET